MSEAERSGGEEPFLLPRTERTDEGLLLRHLPHPLVACLLEVPAILESGRDERLRSTVHPPVHPGDPDEEREWRRIAGDELLHLYAGRARIVAKDLESLALEPQGGRFRLEIPESHRAAWLSSLAAARLILAEIHDIDEEDMQAERDFEEPTAKDVALWRIDALALFQELLIHGPGELGDAAESPEDEESEPRGRAAGDADTGGCTTWGDAEDSGGSGGEGEADADGGGGG